MTANLANTSDFNRWRRTSPFAIIFFVRGTIRQIRAYGQLLVTFGLAFLIVRARELAGELIPAAILLIVVVAVLRYWFFRFRVTEDRILIRQGILKKTALDLPLDRVQAVNIQRSLTDRLLGLVTVSVDTAGSGAVEAVIPSVKAAFADRIRGQVAAARREGRGSDADVLSPRHADEARDAQTDDETRSAGEVMMKLPTGDIVRIGLRLLGDSAFWVLPVALLARDPRDLLRYLAGQFGFLEPISRDEVPQDLVSDFAELIFRAGFLAALVVLIAALSIYGAFKTWYGFKLYRDGAVYRTRAGLFTQREVVVQSVKVQQATLSQNLWDRCLRRFSLTVKTVSDDEEVGLVVRL
ncbi:MAG: PH domain-containing protein, partial [Gemmatimonadetes bacterium]|nr:PH domain-containing protein [Gemmatimonadota bacterium]